MSQGNLVHTLPIHMGVADPVLWGLSDMQLLKVGAGIVVAGCLWRQTALPLGLRTEQHIGLSDAVDIGAGECKPIK